MDLVHGHLLFKRELKVEMINKRYGRLQPTKNGAKIRFGGIVNPWLSSLRSKRFQSSYSAKVRAGAKKKKNMEGPSPSPLIPSFFALVPTFSTNSRGNSCYAG